MTRQALLISLLGALVLVSNDSVAAGGARSVTVDARRVVGYIRSLQGAHWDPGVAGSQLSENYVDLGIDMIRTHDAGGINGSGSGDVDGVGVDRIFPNWDADPSDPASYNFGPTDALIENIRNVGAEVFFRVGRSNIWGFSNANVPPDFDKYAEIVRHIVLHYNQGWANGFSYGIRYFEIWNEPDFLPFWTGTPEEYYDLYGKLATTIKSIDPYALVGGPAITTFNDYTGMRASFLEYVRDAGLPLDFYSYHKYTNKSNDPLDYSRIARVYRDELDSYGFWSTKIVNSEFGTSLAGDPVIGGEAGLASFAAVAQMYMQDAPVDKAMTYMMIGEELSKENLGFKAVSMLNDTPWRLGSEGGDDTGFAVMSGRSLLGKELRIVIANYEISPLLMGPIPGGNDESLDIPGLGHLGTMSYLDRRTISYQNTEGYQLTVKSIPLWWGNLTLEQYRIDNDNAFALVSSRQVARPCRGGDVTLSGAWVHSPAAPPADPMGVAQGVDLIVIRGDGSSF